MLVPELRWEVSGLVPRQLHHCKADCSPQDAPAAKHRTPAITQDKTGRCLALPCLASLAAYGLVQASDDGSACG